MPRKGAAWSQWQWMTDNIMSIWTVLSVGGAGGADYYWPIKGLWKPNLSSPLSAESGSYFGSQRTGWLPKLVVDQSLLKRWISRFCLAACRAGWCVIAGLANLSIQNLLVWLRTKMRWVQRLLLDKKTKCGLKQNKRLWAALHPLVDLLTWAPFFSPSVLLVPHCVLLYGGLSANS